MNDKAVYRTAPATSGLLNTSNEKENYTFNKSQQIAWTNIIFDLCFWARGLEIN